MGRSWVHRAAALARASNPLHVMAAVASVRQLQLQMSLQVQGLSNVSTIDNTSKYLNIAIHAVHTFCSWVGDVREGLVSYGILKSIGEGRKDRDEPFR